jgi:hypothetical protein
MITIISKQPTPKKSLRERKVLPTNWQAKLCASTKCKNGESEQLQEKTQSPYFVNVSTVVNWQVSRNFLSLWDTPMQKMSSTVSFRTKRAETLTVYITKRLNELKVQYGQGAREKSRRRFTSPWTSPINPSAHGCQGLSLCARCSWMNGFICPRRHVDYSAYGPTHRWNRVLVFALLSFFKCPWVFQFRHWKSNPGSSAHTECVYCP